MDSGLVYFVAYILLFSGACIGLGFWHICMRRDRPPVEFKLLRGPGETLRRGLAKSDENLMLHVGGWALLPLVVFGASGWIGKQVEAWAQAWVILSVIVLLFAIALLYSIRGVVRGILQYRSNWLGYMGERFVGEKLTPLEREGYRVYHDIPAAAGDRKFNLDHVVVGPTGLWLVETKTRRKGRARPGFKDSEVTFDGIQLIWPWGEDRKYLKQADDRARWLSEEVKRLTGIDIAARPILALPGWWVNERKLGSVRVLNPINIPSAIRGRGQRVLGDDQIDLIARQLEDRCRDVED